MEAPLEVLDRAQADFDPSVLVGRRVDFPKADPRPDARSVPVIGWVLPRSGPAVAVELLHEGRIIRRVLVTHRRPDLAESFPDVPWAATGGFRTELSFLAISHDVRIHVQAVLANQERLPIGHIDLRPAWREGATASDLVSVIIPCYNQAHYLEEAIESVLHQTYPHVEIVVVDDGSTDNTFEVASRYPGVLCIRQENSGLSAARNRGVGSSRGDYLVFLDADDRLRPRGIEAGIEVLRGDPELAFASGPYANIDQRGNPLPSGPPPSMGPIPTDRDAYVAFLRGDYVGMHGTVMYRKAAFQSVGGFDGRLAMRQDYDLYLRLARRYPVGRHDTVVAEYREQTAAGSRDAISMLRDRHRILRSQRRHVGRRRDYRAAYRAGKALSRDFYGGRVVDLARSNWEKGDRGIAVRGLMALLRYDPGRFLGALRILGRPWTGVGGGLRRLTGPAGWSGTPSVGDVRFGDLRRTRPVSEVFGFDRGRPVDRYYIERFLAQNAHRIRGRVLEIEGDTYTRAFGGDKVTKSDVLDIVPDNPNATIVADLEHADHLPGDTYDCIIFTQTLMYMEDFRGVVATLHRILKPGGVLLATLPGITPLSPEDWSEQWMWRFTALSTRRAFEHIFPPDAVRVETDGNVLSATAFLYGLTAEELARPELDARDPRYEVTITVEAVRPVKETHRKADSVASPRRLPAAAAILLYHSISEPGADPWTLRVTPRHFSEHLEVVRRFGPTLQVRTLTKHLLGGDLPRGGIVVAFDDGYADNLHTARPLFERYDVPASSFLVSGWLGRKRTFWWDELADLFLLPGSLPEELELKLGGKHAVWHLGTAAQYGQEDLLRYKAWRAWDDPPTARHRIYRELWEILRHLREEERLGIMIRLRRWMGVGVSPGRSRPLTTDEVLDLAESGLVEIGGHTDTHPVLSMLPPREQDEEIKKAKARLEEILDAPVTSFAYPYGQPADVGPQTPHLAKQAGFGCACAVDDALVTPSSDPFRLPRLFVEDMDGDGLEELLRRVFEGHGPPSAAARTE
jgi:glycosyltransferase involved in cell wall biosynthesis/peptidoglycan/xylan/chitin deacetylase (PgdA/CDA1 family)